MGPRLTQAVRSRVRCVGSIRAQDLICNSTTHHFPAVSIIIFPFYDIVLTACPCLVSRYLIALVQFICHALLHIPTSCFPPAVSVASPRLVSPLISSMLIISARRSVLYCTPILSEYKSHALHTSKIRTRAERSEKRATSEPVKKIRQEWRSCNKDTWAIRRDYYLQITCC